MDFFKNMNLFNQLPFCVILLDENFNLICANEFTKKLFNFQNNKPEFIKEIIDEAKKPSDVKVKEKFFVFEKEHEISGKRFFFRWYIEELPDKKFLITGFDITDKINAEIKLKEQEETYRGIIDSILEAIYIQDENGVFLDVNKGAEKMYGYPREYFIGKTPDFVSAPGKNDIPSVVEALKKAFNGIPQKFEFWGVRKNGEIFPKNVRLYKGKYFGKDVVIAVAEDITEKKEAEKKLLESEEKFRLLVEFSGNMIYWITPDKKLKYVSPSCEKITGYTPEEFYNNPDLLIDIVHPEDIEKIKHHAKRKVTEEDKEPIEFRIIRKDGEIRWIRHFCKPIFDKSGNFLGRRGANSDITEYKKLQEKMIYSQKVEILGKITGGIVHDFNNILAAISGYADLSLSLAPRDSDLFKYISNIKNSVKKGENITSKLLSFSKNRIRERKYFQLSNTIAEFYPVLRRLIGEDIELEFILNYKDMIYADPSEIEQIIMNLIINARDAIRSKDIFKRKKKIKLKTDEIKIEQRKKDILNQTVNPGVYALIKVEDNGIGIEEDQLKKIFEPFYSTKNTGTGLGLFIVSSIIKETGGFIFVSSEPMYGTKIDIILPKVEAELTKTSTLQEESTRMDNTHLKNKTVLFVEDEPDVRDFAVQALKSLGCEVLSAGNGIEALKILEAIDYDIDLLITDVVMPLMSGEELAKKAKKRKPDLKIIFSSGYTNGYISEDDQKLFDHFLKKPYTIDELKKILTKLL